MNLLFVYPNFHDPVGPNISLTNLATYINKKTSHNAKILDLTIHKKDWINILKLNMKNVDIVGFTTTIVTTLVSFEVAREIKKLKPNLPIIFGGIYTTCINRKILEFTEVDYICVGEGELSLSNLLNYLENHKENHDYDKLKQISGIWFKRDRFIVENGVSPIIENLNLLDFNDYDLWDTKIIWKFNDHIPIMGSRGCQYACTFCTQWAMHNIYDKITNHHYYRRRSPIHICDEIEYQFNKYKQYKSIKGILFYDDTFTSNLEFVDEFCKEYIQRGLHHKLKWAINARLENLTPDLLKKLKNAGCYYLYVGVESCSDKSRKIYHKNFSKNSIIRKLNFCKEIGLKIKTYFIIDGPYERIADGIETLKFARKLKPDTMHFIPFVPIPNTLSDEIYRKSNPKRYRFISSINDLHNSNPCLKSIYVLGSIVIGHSPLNLKDFVKHLFMGIIGSEKSNKFYATIIFTTMWDYFIQSFQLGKIKFFIDLFQFIKYMIHYNLVLSDLFYFTLKKYQLTNAFKS